MNATPPYRLDGSFVCDVNGDRVLVCSADPQSVCAQRYSERLIDADPWFTCPDCGRLGQRMDEATPEQCGL